MAGVTRDVLNVSTKHCGYDVMSRPAWPPIAIERAAALRAYSMNMPDPVTGEAMMRVARKWEMQSLLGGRPMMWWFKE
jgi:hypothetical protein